MKNRLRNQWGFSTYLGHGGALDPRNGQPMSKPSARLIDIDLTDLDEPRKSTEDFTVYCTAESVGERGEAPTYNHTQLVEFTLRTGSGGIERVEAFRCPGVGKAIHVVANSLRVNARVDDTAYPWRVFAYAAKGVVIPGIATIYGTIGDTAEPQRVVIPEFSEHVRVTARALGALEYRFLLKGNAGFIDNLHRPALELAEARPIHTEAGEIGFRSAFDQCIQITFFRPT